MPLLSVLMRASSRSSSPVIRLLQRSFSSLFTTVNADAARAVLRNSLARGDEFEQQLPILAEFLQTLPHSYKPLQGFQMLLIQHQMAQVSTIAVAATRLQSS